MDLQEQRQQLENHRKNLLKTNLILYSVATAGVILYLWSPLLGITLAAAAMLGVFLVVNPRFKAHRLNVKRTVVEANYAPYLTDVRYQYKEGISLDTIAESGLIWMKNSGKGYVGREHVTGFYKGRSFEQSDISLLRRQFADEVAEKGKVEYVIGTMAIQDCGTPFSASVELIHKGFLSPGETERFLEQKHGFSLVEVGDDDLMKEYDIVSDNPEAAAAILAPHVTKRIRKLQEKARTPIIVGIMDNKLMVILKSRFVVDDYGPRRPIPENLLTVKQLPEMQEFFDLADSLVPTK